jgi:hypothetical protein
VSLFAVSLFAVVFVVCVLFAFRIDFPAIEFFFQSAEEAFDTPIHPGAARFSRLVFIIEQPQYDLKPFGMEERFIVGADARFLIAPDYTDDLFQHFCSSVSSLIWACPKTKRCL